MKCPQPNRQLSAAWKASNSSTDSIRSAKAILAHAEQATETENGYRLEFPNEAPVRRNVERMMSLEGECCGFLSFEVTEDATGGGFVLEITGPESAKELLRSAFSDS